MNPMRLPISKKKRDVIKGLVIVSLTLKEGLPESAPPVVMSSFSKRKCHKDRWPDDGRGRSTNTLAEEGGF